MSPFVQWPLLALVPALVFLALHRMSRRRWVFYAAVIWLVYLPYELAMNRRWLCSGECNIRVDLLFIYPLLALLSLIGLIAAARGKAGT